MHQPPSLLDYRRGRYFKVALVACALAIAVYVWQDSPAVHVRPYGGTWLGYALGIIAVVLILWLMWLGVRKRRYRSRLGTVQGWASAHVYLGASLLVIASLHSGFAFGWNVHTLAFALMAAVIASGFFGVFAYLRYPQMITRNLGGDTLDAVLAQIADLDRKCLRIALDLPDEVNDIVMKACRLAPRELRAGRSLRWKLPGRAPRDPTHEACAALSRIGATVAAGHARLNQQLLTAMTRKALLIERVRHDLRYRGMLQGWLALHVPLSFALLAALIAHVVSVFYFR